MVLVRPVRKMSPGPLNLDLSPLQLQSALIPDVYRLFGQAGIFLIILETQALSGTSAATFKLRYKGSEGNKKSKTLELNGSCHLALSEPHKVFLTKQLKFIRLDYT